MKGLTLMTHTFDRLKCKIPRECLSSYNVDQFNVVNTIQRRSYYSLNKINSLGLRNIKIEEDCVIIEVSGKVLKDKYPLLISLATIEDVFENINKTNLIELDIDKSVNLAEVLSLDVTKDLKSPFEPNSLLLEIYELSGFVKDKYTIGEYETGLSIQKKVTSYKSRLSIYDKHQEILLPSNKQIQSFLTSEQIEGYRNILRIERNYSSLKTIRKGFGIVSNQIRLLDVLGSTTDPLFDFMREFCQKTKEENLCSLLTNF